MGAFPEQEIGTDLERFVRRKSTSSLWDVSHQPASDPTQPVWFQVSLARAEPKGKCNLIWVNFGPSAWGQL